MEYLESCLNSFTYRLIKDAFASIKIGFKFSVLGRLTEIGGVSLRNIFQTSKIIKAVLNWVVNFKGALSGITVDSVLFNAMETLKFDFLLSPLKAAGIMVIVAVATNLVLSLILQRQIILWGWAMCGLFLFIGISGLFCKANWEDIKSTSTVFNKILSKGKK